VEQNRVYLSILIAVFVFGSIFIFDTKNSMADRETEEWGTPVNELRLSISPPETKSSFKAISVDGSSSSSCGYFIRDV
jgi:hypothetical protein